jgi:pimeloyl-ACP methyl ester carboxylesterase
MTNHISIERPVPPIGGFQEIEGRRVYVHREGSGGPAVVFLPGASAVGLDYYLVQQEVSRFTTAVLYDRGGTGFSDPLALPRTATAIATELRDLLRAQNITGPYILAPHSLGGLYAHRFAQLFPDDVAGVVWIDVLHRDWDEFMPPAARLAETERMSPTLEQLESMRPALRAMHAELLADYPAQIRNALVEAKGSAEWLRVGLAERSHLVTLVDELRTGPGIPEVAMIALTALSPQAMDEGKQRMHAAMLAPVPGAEQRLLADTEHHRVCFDRSDAVVQAIRDVIGRVAHT